MRTSRRAWGQDGIEGSFVCPEFEHGVHPGCLLPPLCSLFDSQSLRSQKTNLMPGPLTGTLGVDVGSPSVTGWRTPSKSFQHVPILNLS